MSSNSNGNTNDDDDEPQLSAHALAALNEFYADRDADGRRGWAGEVSEDWQLSQFWYSADTSEALAREARRVAGGRPIACVCTPSVYRSLVSTTSSTIKLFEYDRRFAIYGDDFHYYDYRDPVAGLGEEMRGGFGVVVADPPFLSAECLRAVSDTVRYLLGEAAAEPRGDGGYIILCTGAVMADAARTLLAVTPCFRPKHKNNLANEFLGYTNYPSLLGVSIGGWGEGTH